MAKSPNLKSWGISLLPVLIGIVLISIYFSPEWGGKQILQGDHVQLRGTGEEILDYREQGDWLLWGQSQFSGMPVWMGRNAGNIFIHIHRFFNNLIPSLIMISLMAFFSMYLSLLAFKVNRWFALIGALAFVFTSFNILSLEAGHINKVLAMALMPTAITGVWLIFRQRYLIGSVMTILSIGLQINYAHIQISYYTLLIIIIMGVAELIGTYKEKTWNTFGKAILILIGCGLLAVMPNTSRLWTLAEYAQFTPRGGSNLENRQEERGSGLEKEYALAWSSGKLESLTTLIPGLYGGSSHESLDESSNVYQLLVRNGYSDYQAKQAVQSLPVYWGAQPFTAGPIYFGAIICFLFVFGFWVIRGYLKWWILAAVVLSFMLSWGSNLEWFTNIFFYYIPLYNKFRTVTMVFSIAQMLFPLFAIIALFQAMSNYNKVKTRYSEGLVYSFSITGGLCLVFALLGRYFFDFTGVNDAQLPEWIIASLKEDRMSMLTSSSWRSFFLILVAAGLLWFYFKNKINLSVALPIIGLLIVFDLWVLDKRYLNNQDFEDPEKLTKNIFVASPVDKLIMQDSTEHFRVFNTTRNPFNDGITSYFHKSIGGYSAIKLSRYQELIEAHLSRSNPNVLNMLNTKYIIVTDQEGRLRVRMNNQALGNAWFVNEIKWVENNVEELDALNDINPQNQVVINEEFRPTVESAPEVSFNEGNIKLTSYHPEKMVYYSNNQQSGLAVFSEIYYPAGWEVLVNGEPQEYFRVNYILRGLILPTGENEIVFQFRPKSYYMGEKISLAGSIAIVVLLIGVLMVSIKKPEMVKDKPDYQGN